MNAKAAIEHTRQHAEPGQGVQGTFIYRTIPQPRPRGHKLMHFPPLRPFHNPLLCSATFDLTQPQPHLSTPTFDTGHNCLFYDVASLDLTHLIGHYPWPCVSLASIRTPPLNLPSLSLRHGHFFLDAGRASTLSWMLCASALASFSAASRSAIFARNCTTCEGKS